MDGRRLLGRVTEDFQSGIWAFYIYGDALLLPK